MKILELANSMKTDTLFVDLNLNAIFQQESARKMHISWMILCKQGALKM